MSERTPYNDTIVDQHTRQAEGYARLTRSTMGDRRAQMRAFVGVHPDDELLDVACGPGSLSLELAAHVAFATGIDITPAMLDQARAAQAERGIANVRFVEGDGAALPFADGSFSLVASSAAFHHFEQPARVLAEMLRVCRPGGRIVIVDVAPAAEKAAAYDRFERMRDPSHGHAHSLAEFAAMGRAVGLDEPRVRSNPAGPVPFAAILATSFPESHTREELLALMAEDAASGEDRMGFAARLDHDGTVLVTYPMATMVWTRD